MRYHVSSSCCVIDLPDSNGPQIGGIWPVNLGRITSSLMNPDSYSVLLMNVSVSTGVDMNALPRNGCRKDIVFSKSQSTAIKTSAFGNKARSSLQKKKEGVLLSKLE